MNDGQGYFAGKPAKPNDKEQQAGDEETQAVDAQTPGDYFMGPPANLQQQPAAKQSADQNRSSFLAKCCPCLAGVGGAASKKKSGRVLYAYNSAESFK
uniref:Uncharacterized protein n=2 Tax=Oryza TaxID=4527 RepID=A0A0D3FT52_9ORYZ